MKKEKKEYVFRKRNFELLVFSEIKMKGSGEILWCGVRGIFTDVKENEVVRESITVLLNAVGCS